MDAKKRWWAQTLVGLGGAWSPDVLGVHSVEADGEEEAVAEIARTVEAPEEPAPVVLPRLEREGKARGESDEAVVERMREAIRTALEAEPRGLVITHIGTDFATATGLGTALAAGTEEKAQAA